MTSQTQAPAIWSHLPNLRSFSIGEALRLSVIVGSLSFVVLAGQLAQSRNQELANEHVSANVAVAETVTAKPDHRKTALEKFAATQITSYTQLLDGLTERAETIASGQRLTATELTTLKASLHDFDETLMETREALARLESSAAQRDSRDAKFLEEDLRGSLLALQASASDTQGFLIGFDHAE